MALSQTRLLPPNITTALHRPPSSAMAVTLAIRRVAGQDVRHRGLTAAAAATAAATAAAATATAAAGTLFCGCAAAVMVGALVVGFWVGFCVGNGVGCCVGVSGNDLASVDVIWEAGRREGEGREKREDEGFGELHFEGSESG